MSEGAKWSTSFGTAPMEAMQAYDEILVPNLFAPMAEVLLDELEPRPGERVLDVACGPGTVAFRAAARVGAEGRVTACDLSPAMLEIAGGKPVPPEAAPIDWVESPAAPLAGVPDRAYDLVTCQQGLQFFPDRPAALREMYRALVPGGRLGVATWVPIGQSPVFAALAAAVEEILGEEPASRYRGGPWGLGDADEITRLLVDAGFADVAVVQRTTTGVFAGGPPQLVRTLAAAAVAPEVAALPEEGYAALVAAAARHMEPLTDDRGVVSDFTTNIGLGTRP